MTTRPRPVAIITGAAGGMGCAIARLLGHGHRLLLNDVDAAGLNALTQALRDEGMEVDAVPGDLSVPGLAKQLATEAGKAGPLRAVVNAAGLSPIQADWQAIVQANSVAPARLIAAVEPLLVPGTACIMIASAAGHLGPRDAEAERLLTSPLVENLMEALSARLAILTRADGGTMQGHAYSLTKRAIIQLCEARARKWGESGARILSLSPGLIWTPMGRREADSGQRAQALLEVTPAGRWGTPMDVALAAQFLLSDAASYISGSDIRLDGGVVAVMRGEAF